MRKRLAKKILKYASKVEVSKFTVEPDGKSFIIKPGGYLLVSELPAWDIYTAIKWFKDSELYAWKQKYRNASSGKQYFYFCNEYNPTGIFFGKHQGRTCAYLNDGEGNMDFYYVELTKDGDKFNMKFIHPRDEERNDTVEENN